MKIVSDLNVNNNQIKNFCVESLSGSPEIVKQGKIWLDTETNTMKMGTSDGSTAIFDKETWTNYTSESSIELQKLTILNSANSWSTSTGALVVKGGMGVAGAINADSISGAVWNDYAEYRESITPVAPGYCVCEVGNGRVIKSSKRLQKLPMIVSDTYGFSIGKINEDDVPIAVCGRVLAYTDKSTRKFKVGDWVCAGKEGKVSKMNFFEKIFFPDRRVGIVSSRPQTKTWGTGNVSTENRIWIKV